MPWPVAGSNRSSLSRPAVPTRSCVWVVVRGEASRRHRPNGQLRHSVLRDHGSVRHPGAERCPGPEKSDEAHRASVGGRRGWLARTPSAFVYETAPHAHDFREDACGHQSARPPGLTTTQEDRVIPGLDAIYLPPTPI
jgi:hypothetical protein